MENVLKLLSFVEKTLIFKMKGQKKLEICSLMLSLRGEKNRQNLMLELKI